MNTTYKDKLPRRPEYEPNWIFRCPFGGGIVDEVNCGLGYGWRRYLKEIRLRFKGFIFGYYSVYM